jgi:hypothetical protein
MPKGGIEKAPECGKQHHRTDGGRFQAETARRVPVCFSAQWAPCGSE